MIAQICNKNYEIAEITCSTKYFEEASSVNFKRSVQYELGVLMVSVKYFLNRNKIMSFQIFKK